MSDIAIRPWLPLNSGLNLRDVGGLPCGDGGSTRYRTLLRSGSLRLLSAEDAEILTGMFGVHTVLDLRTARELSVDGPSALARAGAATVHLPLIREDRAALPESENETDPTAALHVVYQDYLDQRGHHLVTAARLVAWSEPESTLVHCAAGKDRTGVTIAVLLDAVGVDRAAVIADYAATNEVIEQILSTLATAHGYEHEIDKVDVSAHLARPAALRAVLERLDNEYGGAAGWLRHRGLGGPELTTLRRRLVHHPVSALDE